MSRFIVDLWLDGYDTEEERKAAEIAFIKEALDFSGSSVKVTLVSDESPPRTDEALQ